MNISQLEYLLASIDHGSYASASKELYVTPQAISKSIKELERELGVELLVRQGRGVRPTEFALELRSHAELILNAVEAIRVKASLSVAGPLSLQINRGGEIYGRTDRSEED